MANPEIARSRWYVEFCNKHGRTPTDAEMREVAKPAPEVTSKPPYRLHIRQTSGYAITIVEEGAWLRVTVTSPQGAWTGEANDIDQAIALMTRIIVDHPLKELADGQNERTPLVAKEP